jgi:hypothetical protein
MYVGVSCVGKKVVGERAAPRWIYRPGEVPMTYVPANPQPRHTHHYLIYLLNAVTWSRGDVWVMRHVLNDPLNPTVLRRRPLDQPAAEINRSSKSLLPAAAVVEWMDDHQNRLSLSLCPPIQHGQQAVEAGSPGFCIPPSIPVPVCFLAPPSVKDDY